MNAQSRKFAVGLTGGIGSGKSSAAAHFARLGAFVIDADALSRTLTQPHGAALAAIARAFPGVVTAGVLDRVALRQRVFDQPSERVQLEAILHPMIGAATRTALASPEATNAAYVMHVVPLLFESKNYAARIDCAVVVDVDEATQITRVTSSRNVSAGTVEQIINSQMPRAERLLRTQFVIDNSGAEALLAPQVTRLHQVFLANAAHHAAAALRAHEGATA